jgi:hypothetical protein
MRYSILILLLPVMVIKAEELYAIKKFNTLINVDSITALKHAEQVTIVKKGEDRAAPFYYALTIKDIPYPAKRIDSLIDNVKRYSKQFGHVKQSREIDEPSACYFLELRARMARSWLVGNVRKIDASDSLKQVAFVQNHDKQLNDKWKKERRGLINVGYRHFQIIWLVKKIADNQSQVALVAFVKPRAGIPDWLAQTTAKTILPSFIQDIEKNLAEIKK